MNNNSIITVNGVDYAPITDTNPDAAPVSIVILQRGWVFVGRLTIDGDNCTLTDARNIRVWGTTAGLGQLWDGPTDDTVIDPAGTVRFHHQVMVASIDADPDGWADTLNS